MSHDPEAGAANDLPASWWRLFSNACERIEQERRSLDDARRMLFDLRMEAEAVYEVPADASLAAVNDALRGLFPDHRERDAPEVVAGESGVNAGGLGLVSAAVLLAEPEEAVRWLVDEMLPTAGFSVLAAKPKVGKSTLARQLAVACAKGRPFLGREVLPGPVVYLALEEKRDEVRRHFREMGVTSEDPINCYFGVAPVDALARLRKNVDKLKPVLVIVDPLFRMARVKDGNDYAQVTTALEPFMGLARETRAHLLVVHHSGKADRSGADAILGSTAIFGAVDTAVLLRRTERYRTVTTTQRCGQDLEETVLSFDTSSRTVNLAGSREEEEQARLEAEILQVLSAKDAAMDEQKISDEIEGRTGLKRKALRALVSAGKIERDGGGKRRDPFTYRVSRFLVPDLYREQGNEKSKTVENQPQHWPKGRSHDFAIPAHLGNENLDLGNENSTAEPAAVTQPEEEAGEEVFEV